MIDLLSNYTTISIIGMAKNVGKTTTLNYILKQLYQKKTIGLTSIGRDGEELDLVTHTSKPKIYVEKGTIIATTTNCLKNSDFTKQILEKTNITTSLGDVVIVRALSDGFVDLAGPSFNAQVKMIIDLFKKYHVELTLIDGALDRKGIASHIVSEATILATGASYDMRMHKVVKDTKDYVHLLMLGETQNQFIRAIYHELPTVSLINHCNEITPIHVLTTMSKEEIVDSINMNTKYLILKGALSQELLSHMMTKRIKDITIIVDNGTKCIFDVSLLEQLDKYQIFIEVMNRTHILCLTYNPISPIGYQFEDLLFKKLLEEAIQLPIFNVMRDA